MLKLTTLLVVFFFTLTSQAIIVDDCSPFGPPCTYRGDVNGDGTINVTDGVYLSSFLFQGGPPPPCILAADTNNDGDVNITDVINIYNFLFGGCRGCIVAPYAVDC